MILSDFYIIRLSDTSNKLKDYAKPLDTSRYIYMSCRSYDFGKQYNFGTTYMS